MIRGLIGAAIAIALFWGVETLLFIHPHVMIVVIASSAIGFGGFQLTQIFYDR